MRILIFISFIYINVSFADNHSHNKHDHGHDKKNISLEAHEHGSGKVNIVQENNNILLEFDIPGNDILGFEYVAKTKEDIKKTKRALKKLENPENLILISNEADCRVSSANTNLLHEGNHGEFLIRYIFNCKDLSKLEALNFSYFDSFPDTENLEVNVIAINYTGSFLLRKKTKILKSKGFFVN